MEQLKPILQSNHIHHAYLFCGPKGSEKDHAAIYFARSLLCQQEPIGGCGICSDCLRVEHGNHPSLVSIQPDGSKIKLQQLKELQKRFALKTIEGTYQIYILEEADKMTTEAANSLLKFLEEPVGATVAILLAEQPGALLPTIVSRCQMIRFHRIDASIIAKAYMDKGVAKEQADFLSQIWSDVDQVVEMMETEKFATIQKLVVQLSEDLLKKRHQYLVILDTEWFAKKPSAFDIDFLIDYILFWFRDLLVRELNLETRGLFPDQEILKYRNSFSTDILQKWIQEIMRTKQALRYNVNPHLAVESLFLKMQEELMCTGL
ncbi:DNA polymerase III subunit delta' [Desulfuribacillus stibiiarsenatis]|uniref:DNA polymerase III subunit delta n=1 Tax=Desulfuribacillus stibiiarsenatis TaxID=1390249 RepID=A0A1E5L2D8_9FIRM|nr:DNA polymerase III subunit delta' [Desulfuribacillus stibiiarsenatis]OEH84322.1 DNA polymerase III subunit delta' [Desulfuribacillus stibiiarsenatis]